MAKTKTCGKCGKEFVPTHMNQRYCKECRPKGGDKQCPICGKIFRPTKKHKTYCSEECAVSGGREKKRERDRARARRIHGTTKTCEECGKEFTPDTFKRTLCEKCRGDSSEKTCRYCGQTFVPTHGNQAYCSQQCRIRHNYEKNHEKIRHQWYEKHGNFRERERYCLWCDKPFYPTATAQQYCSPECREKSAEQYRKDNQEYKYAYHVKYRDRNRERHNEVSKRYYWKNREKILAKNRQKKAEEAQRRIEGM